MTRLFEKISKKKVKTFLNHLLFGVLLFVLIILSLFLSYLIVYKNKVYPNLSIAGVKISNLTLEQASSLISSKIEVPGEISLVYEEDIYKISSEEIDLYFDITDSTIRAYKFTRTGNIFQDFKNRVILLFSPKNLSLEINLDNEKLSNKIEEISKTISKGEVAPSISKTKEGLSVNKGVPGKRVDTNKLEDEVINHLSFNTGTNINIPVDNVDNTLNDEEATAYLVRAEKLLNKNLVIEFEYNSLILKDTNIFKFLDPKGTFDDEEITKIIEKASHQFERDPQNPKFVFNGGKVTEFQPALDGVKVKTDELKSKLIEKIIYLESSSETTSEIELPVSKTPSDITTDKVNDLGIKELIGRGSSTYYHSIPGRVHNVSLAAGRINGTLVKPGETFSFNSTLGDVSAFTGYKQAYIISEGKTVLGDGGGVCQVSSTLFRAVLDAGLPINERQAHAYRVGYYEQGSSPGFDATVFSPSPDFKFTNDTGNYVLIESIVDSKNYSLVFELYGTKDGRASTVSKPVVSNVSAPPPDVYQDDPTLPVGTTKQIDYKAWGAKVTFNYKVTKSGEEIINRTFISNYKPWAAVYLKGTAPI